MRFRSIAFMALLGVAALSPPAFANLVVNGGFESPVVTASPGYEYRKTGDAGWGWTTTSTSGAGTVQFNAAYGQSIGAGNQSIQLELGTDAISQMISTIAGEKYTLSFLLASYVPPGTDTLRVFVDSAFYDFAGTDQWVMHSFDFVAATSSTLIEFMSTDPLPSPPYTYPHLDDISVVAAVPAPATLALVGLGLVALGSSRRRRS